MPRGVEGRCRDLRLGDMYDLVFYLTGKKRSAVYRKMYRDGLSRDAYGFAEYIRKYFKV